MVRVATGKDPRIWHAGHKGIEGHQAKEDDRGYEPAAREEEQRYARDKQGQYDWLVREENAGEDTPEAPGHVFQERWQPVIAKKVLHRRD